MHLYDKYKKIDSFEHFLKYSSYGIGAGAVQTSKRVYKVVIGL